MRKRSRTYEETSQISSKLDSYDDIFSDFDIRDYARRSLSSDFLDELRRAAQDKRENGTEILIHIPKRKRKENQEAVIAARLQSHFNKHYVILKDDKKNIVKKGVIMVLLGILAMIGVATILYEMKVETAFSSLLIAFLDPAAWFLLWEGMDQIIFNSKEANKDLSFYKKMSHKESKISFYTY
jgi:hypothetical protein